ncbi:DUF4306 domain-containing protein [Metabacillus litoralis]|uniref:DUF4306 domain-containing protein n=1 Tax=Metabacillus litoralis TaxID=152268 RepID=A0A5C6VRK1_9BACI|nr:YjdJ family protein [Metabacillus litoralis]TXC86028.1 DUF4306 domain-containing protein [Metabacillus litoralis]
MSVKFITHLASVIMLLLFFSIASWYEGSELLDHPWEWKYTAIFSQMVNAEILNKSDISQLDFFIYAIKFKPLYPMLMMVAIIYMILLLGYSSYKTKPKKFALFLTALGVFIAFLGNLISHSPTVGGSIFKVSLIVTGSVCLCFGVVYYFQLYRVRNKRFN